MIEPELIPIDSDYNFNSSGNVAEKARLDVSSVGLWSPLEKNFMDIRVFHPNEQLDFCKGAQTNDHIFTLKTVIDKYTRKHKVRVYACFVDLRKAFDTVCRDLLLHKITCLGISGNFFNCLTDMYLNSVARHPDVGKMVKKSWSSYPLPK